MDIGIDSRLPFYQLGGISQYIIHLLPALAEVEQENRYIIGHMRKDPRSYLPPYSERFVRLNLMTPCHHRWEQWALGLELRGSFRHFDIWHSPDFIPPRLVKRPVITVHDLNFIHYPQFLEAESRRFYLNQIRWAVQTAAHISADSHHTRQDLIELLAVPPEKVTTVHLAVNPLYQRDYAAAEIAQTLAQHNLPRGFILAVGTLEPRKNLTMLLQAYACLRAETNIDVPLVLVGRKGWLYDEIFSTIQTLGLQNHVRHLEGVFDEALAHLYHAAGVLVTPSHYEGFGLPALEALTCGCPIIVSKRGSLPEIAGEAGLLLEANDVSAWAEAIGRVLTESTLRQTMIATGLAHAQTFSWHTAAQQTVAIYERVMAL